MRVVHINDVRTPAMCYVHVEQPMYIYHSYEEFLTNVFAPREIISNLGDYLQFVQDNAIDLNYNSNNKYVDVTQYNVWIQTIDKFIPETVDFGGEITYKLDNEGNKIPTDGCFIRIYYITPTPTRNVLFTSAGVNTIGLTKWQPTAAQRYNYSQESDPRASKDKKEVYNARVEKLSRVKKETVPMVKLVSAMLNPASVLYLDFNGAASRTFPWLRANDRKKILESQSFRSVLMSVLKTYFPELAPAIREKHNPEEMAAKLQKAFDIAAEKKDVKGMLDVISGILSAGYEENVVVNDLTGQPQLPKPPKQISEGENGKDKSVDDFLSGDDAELSMEDILPSEEEVKASYPASSIASSEEEIKKMLDND